MSKMSLTPNELEIMKVLWESKEPLSRSEIIEASPNRSWKASSIHILLNKMLEKEVIHVAGFKKTGKTYGRTFGPLLSEQEYYSTLFSSKNNKATPVKEMLPLFSALLDQTEITDETIDHLEQLLENKRNILLKHQENNPK